MSWKSHIARLGSERNGRENKEMRGEKQRYEPIKDLDMALLPTYSI